MSDLAIVAMSAVLSLLSAVIVAAWSSRLQRNLEIQRLVIEKGEDVIYKINFLTNLYIQKYNIAYTCEQNGNMTPMEEKFGLGTELFNTMMLREEEIHSAIKIHFRSCASELTQWHSALGETDVFYGRLADGSPALTDNLDAVTRCVRNLLSVRPWPVRDR